MAISTKVDMNHNQITRTEALEEFARILFPGNKNHQKTFLVIYVELKWTAGQFLSRLEPIAAQHNIGQRTLETVRSKMRRMGLIDHVSRFSLTFQAFLPPQIFVYPCQYSAS